MASKPPKNLKKKLANPGERSKLPPKYLSKQQQQQRAMNARLNAPIASFQTPQGTINSPTTERMLANQANAATTVQFGGEEQSLKQALAQAVQHQQNVGTYYDEYRQNLQDLQKQADAYNAGMRDANMALPGMVTGLAQGTQGNIQQAQIGRPNSDVGAATTQQNLSNAAAIGQAAAGSLAAQGNIVGNANQQYLTGLANGVAPAAKIQALTGAQQGITNAQGNITALKGKEGAYNAQYRDTQRQNEQKNLLAEATLGLNTQKAAADAKANSPAGAAAKTAATEEAKQAQKYGMSVHQWRMLGPKGRQALITAKSGGKGGDKGFYGYTSAQWDKMSPQQRRDAKAAWDQAGKSPKTAKKPKPTSGPGSLPAATEDKKVTQINSIVSFIKSGPKWQGGPAKGKPMTTEEVIHHYQAGGTPKDVLEVVQSLLANGGKLGPGGVAAAHRLGIHVNGRWGLVGKAGGAKGAAPAAPGPGTGTRPT